MVPARLILQNGETYEGVSPPWQKGHYFGEVVFTTGMVGYVESLTDPSYAGQILVFTFPLIGNYGVPKRELWESHTIQVSGVVLSQLSPFHSHYEAEKSLLDWLKEYKIPLLCQVDTRALTKSLRKEGVALGVISHEKTAPKTFFDPNATDLVSKVSCRKAVEHGFGKKKIILVDCGVKQNILRCLLQFPLRVKQVPHDYDYTQEDYDGLFLSNGPGDPMLCTQTAAILKKALLKNKPIFGICLGAQILALSIGAKTYKLPYGHRGQNQPCQLQESKRCYLTSQNHGYAIEEKTLPPDWKVTFRNLNDLSVEGIAHCNRPFFAVQFHPEASPGPVDPMYLFQQFYELL
jgi:carbamoyl-phosphate synthase small subunit